MGPILFRDELYLFTDNPPVSCYSGFKSNWLWEDTHATTIVSTNPTVPRCVQCAHNTNFYLLHQINTKPANCRWSNTFAYTSPSAGGWGQGYGQRQKKIELGPEAVHVFGATDRPLPIFPFGPIAELANYDIVSNSNLKKLHQTITSQVD